MNEKILKSNIIKATKWSAITEIASKLVSPVTNIILARLVTPEAFGVVTTITMIISFADMLTDAGFQKYLVQHEFKNEEEMSNCVSVAFWSNLAISLILWMIIIIFSDKIANLVGNNGLGFVISIACMQLPMTSFSSIQTAMFRREFDFKTLFWVRMIGISVPFIVTIPLAFLGFSYWALIIGTIILQLLNAIVLTWKSKWKPRVYFNIRVLKEILSFSIWSLMEAITIWLSAWIDIFIIGSKLDKYHLGLYKTSITMVNLIFAIVMSTIIPILYSTLSRLQEDENLFKDTFYKTQKIVAYLILPMSIGIFLYSDVITNVMLGSQWVEGGYIIGIWGITSGIKIIFSDLNSECYRAKGYPKTSFFVQISHIIILIPICILGLSYGFKVFVYSRAIIRVQLIITSILVMQFFIGISFKDMIIQTKKPILASLLLSIFIIVLRYILVNHIIINILSIIICIIMYLVIVYFISREDFEYLQKNLKHIIQKNKVN